MSRFSLFRDDESYSFGDLKQIFPRTKEGDKPESDASRAKTIRNWLKKHGIHGCAMPGRGTAYSGRVLNQVIEEQTRWPDEDE